jgi:hypothetical protein
MSLLYSHLYPVSPSFGRIKMLSLICATFFWLSACADGTSESAAGAIDLAIDEKRSRTRSSPGSSLTTSIPSGTTTAGTSATVALSETKTSPTVPAVPTASIGTTEAPSIPGTAPVSTLPASSVSTTTPISSATIDPIPVLSADAAAAAAATAAASASRTNSSSPPVTKTAPTILANSNQQCTSGKFPTQWVWTNPNRTAQALPADYVDGQPLIKQMRAGKLVATYSNLGATGVWSPERSSENPGAGVGAGAFRRTPFRSWLPGDVFEVYPAVYEEENQHPWVGPHYDSSADWNNKNFIPPTNITLRGITVNGKRPLIRIKNGGNAAFNNYNQSLVYFEGGKDITFENFDITMGTSGSIGKAAIYANGVENLTLRNLRIYGFKAAGANGIFTTGAMKGTLRLDNLELSDNGGDAGPEHNIYINRSSVDPTFTVHMTNSWSKSVFYGHTYKSRAQRNVLEGNYFMGARATDKQAEAFLVNIPEGGELVMRNNVMVKTYSGDNSNGASVTFANEGVPDARKMSVLMEHNTFVGFTRYYDTQNHPIYPMLFFYPGKLPGDAGFNISSFSVKNNAFVGYCPHGTTFGDYRGEGAVIAGFSDITADFSLVSKINSTNTSIIGSASYSHGSVSTTRKQATVGARD